LFDLYNEQGEWTGHLRDEDVATLALDTAEYLCGPAGSVTVHNCRTIHGSPVNSSGVARPLLLSTMTAADAFPYTHNPIQSPNDGALVRGEAARWSHHDPRPCQLPPDWSGGYTSIFDYQQRSQKHGATG
jgi:ectoine hydroxylase